MNAIRPSFAALLVLALLAMPARGDELEDLRKTFLEGEDSGDRVSAGIKLALAAPDAFATAVEEAVERLKEGDERILATVAVKLKVRHLRLLLAWAADQWKDLAVPAFLARVDNDYPLETMRAIEAIGFVGAGDGAAMTRLYELLRNPDELIAVEAARAIARVGTKRDAAEVAKNTVEVDNSHVRVHLAWAVQDLVGGRSGALKMFARYAGRNDTIGYRGKEAMAIIDDDLAPPEKYKVKLETIRSFFNPRGGTKPPPVDAPKEEKERIEKALQEIYRKSPAWYHMICSSVKRIKVTGEPEFFDFPNSVLNLKFAELIKWDRSELIEYYLVRYACILFLARMGDPQTGHRGWEEGFIEDWLYAMEHTMIALDEDLRAYVKERLKASPW